MSDPDLEQVRVEYRSDFRSLPQNPQHPWHPLNPVAMHYRFVREQALGALFRKQELHIEEMRCLDIGCGFGAELRYLLMAGARPDRIHGIELLPERATIARQTIPLKVAVVVGDAGSLPYPSNSFDLVTQYTVFSSMKSESLRLRAAAEISRILSPGGSLIWYDMHRTRSRATNAISQAEIKQIFSRLQLISITQLHSLYTARLAKRSAWLAWCFDSLPGLPKTHYLALLQKPN